MYVIYMMITIIRTLYKNEKGRSCLGTIENNVKVVIYCVVGISEVMLLHLVFKYFDMSLLPMWKKLGLHIIK
jgi:hypothetical protein